MKEWDSIYEAAERICCGDAVEPDSMEDEEHKSGMMQFVKSVMEEKVHKDLAWKS